MDKNQIEQESEFDYSVIIIGSGPGGESAAKKCTKMGHRVAIVENNDIGGGCTSLGTIPSKALRQFALDFDNTPNFNFNFPKMLESARRVINEQIKVKRKYYNRNNIDIHFGFARFIDENTISIEQSDGTKKTLSAKNLIIATGSRPFSPNGIDFNHNRILNSDKILTVKDKGMHSVVIYGAGIIGCEYASILANLNMKVTLINTRDRLLSYLDNEIIDTLSYHLSANQKIIIIHNEEYESIIPNDNNVVINFRSGRKVKADYMLFAIGRTGNTQNMNLDEIGIILDKRGLIEVNENYQTHASHIYAVGDVIGAPSLASSAFNQGRFAATHMLTGSCDVKLMSNIPTGIYTKPEVSCIGKTENQLIKEKVPFEVGRAFFKDIARAQISGTRSGMLKILFHRDTLEILGIHCFGPRASDIIHIGQAIMAQPGELNTIEYFLNTTFNYPTMAEAYRAAALNGINNLR